MAAITDPFARSGVPAKAKLIILGSPDFLPESLMNRARSLNLEHVSLDRLKGPEISRRRSSAVSDETTTIAAMRRWFFARKPDAGLVVCDVPATLLQAKVFDEWLDSRDEALSAVVATQSGSVGPVAEHYRTLGLLLEPSDLVA